MCDSSSYDSRSGSDELSEENRRGRSSSSTETEEQEEECDEELSSNSEHQIHSDDYNSSSERGEVSFSDSSSQDSSADRRHIGAVMREKDMVLQRQLYHQNRGFVVEVDTANAIKRVLKEKIFPKIKILSGREQDYLTPDFVGDVAEQSRLICDKVVHELELPNTLKIESASGLPTAKW
jgi:hypothetical protein